MELTKILESQKDIYSKEEVTLYKHFDNDVIIRGDTVLVPLNIAKELIDKSVEIGLAIVGIDVFKVSDDGITPIDIADYSSAAGNTWIEYKTSCHRASLDFLKEQPMIDSTYLEFVFNNEDEWNQPAN